MSIYYVTTKDGYILKIYRISGGKNSKITTNKNNKKVVLLQHGLEDSCDSWISNLEEKALPFMLANLNYDVWLGNNRGNKYSRQHLTMNPDKDKEFWNFSLHEMGTLDLPAIIDFILKETGSEKISYVGHSQGTAQLFAALTLNNDYFSQRLNSFLAFGPVTNLKNLQSLFLRGLAISKFDILLSNLKLWNEFLPNSVAFNKFKDYACFYASIVCTNILNMISDKSTVLDDMSRFLVFNSHFPSGSSLKSVHHFADSIRYGRFSQLDEQRTPYDLTKINNIPIFLFVGELDLLATVEDNKNLKDILESIGVLKFYKEYKDYGHGTFFFSKTNEHGIDAIKILEEINK